MKPILVKATYYQVTRLPIKLRDAVIDKKIIQPLQDFSFSFPINWVSLQVCGRGRNFGLSAVLKGLSRELNFKIRKRLL